MEVIDNRLGVHRVLEYKTSQTEKYHTEADARSFKSRLPYAVWSVQDCHFLERYQRESTLPTGQTMIVIQASSRPEGPCTNHRTTPGEPSNVKKKKEKKKETPICHASRLYSSTSSDGRCQQLGHAELFKIVLRPLVEATQVFHQVVPPGERLAGGGVSRTAGGRAVQQLGLVPAPLVPKEVGFAGEARPVVGKAGRVLTEEPLWRGFRLLSITRKKSVSASRRRMMTGEENDYCDDDRGEDDADKNGEDDDDHGDGRG